ncbi:MAG: hypothetical protein HWE18_06830 [Gammaproteobacteria bacterium]|nr:hypothetical protein [Gammaproteobacteria bacterium]
MFRHRLSALIAFVIASPVFAQPLNYLGDMLPAGQQQVSTELALSDRYAGGNYIEDATVAAIDDLDRGITSARTKGYSVKTDITYLMGISSDLNVGFKYGYEYQKSNGGVDGDAGDGIEGNWVNEGGTDISLLANMRISEIAIFENQLQLPVCSADSSVCKNRVAAADGQSGGAAQGLLAYKAGVAANWLTEMDTRWMGRAYASAAMSEEVDGKKVSSPISMGASMGTTFPLAMHHQMVGTLSMDYMLEYSAYSPQVQRKVAYSEQSRVSFKLEYLWDVMSQMQLRPFVDVAITQQPSQTFVMDGQRRRLEYTGGTQVTLGAQFSAAF